MTTMTTRCFAPMRVLRFCVWVLLAAPSALAAGNGRPAPSASRLHIEVSWDSPVTAGFDLRDTHGNFAILHATDNRNTIPNCDVTVNGQTGAFDIDPADADGYRLNGWIFGPDPTCTLRSNATVDWYLDGCLIQTFTLPIYACFQFGITNFGSAQPGAPCLPKLYLDADLQFSSSLHRDDLPKFVPGALLDGTSLNPGSLPQALRLVAVAPSGGNVTFQIEPGSESHYPGKAMNYPIIAAATGPDVYFRNSKGDVTLGPVSAKVSGGFATTTIYVDDYAASATVKATIPTGPKLTAAVTMRIPQDSNGNTLPDVGWQALPWPGQSTPSQVNSNQINRAEDDFDTNPSGPSQAGDGLSAYEEYRGFVVGGKHIRTNPFVRDLFIDADPVALELVEALPFNTLFIVSDESESTEVERVTPNGRTWLTRIKPIINPNRANVPGSRLLGQRAVRVIYQQDTYPVNASSDGRVHEVWLGTPEKSAVGGMAFTNQYADFSVLNNYTQNPQPGNPNATPNDIQFVEIYDRFFQNSGLSTEDFTAPHYDRFGHVVDNCDDSFSSIYCDRWDRTSGIFRPIGQNRGNGIEIMLNAVLDTTAHPADYYSTIGNSCDSPPIERKLLDYEWASMLPVVVAHETAHALRLNHTGECGTIMYSASRSLVDTYPIPDCFSEAEKGEMKLWQP